jgi:hypothetical protein
MELLEPSVIVRQWLQPDLATSVIDSGLEPLVPGCGDQGTLPRPQPQWLAVTMATRHPYVVAGKPRNRQLAASGAAQRQRGPSTAGLGPALIA